MTGVWLRWVASAGWRRPERTLRRAEEARYHHDLRPSRRQRTVRPGRRLIRFISPTAILRSVSPKCAPTARERE